MGLRGREIEALEDEVKQAKDSFTPVSMKPTRKSRIAEQSLNLGEVFNTLSRALRPELLKRSWEDRENLARKCDASRFLSILSVYCEVTVDPNKGELKSELWLIDGLQGFFEARIFDWGKSRHPCGER